jgi:phosphonopyruvate decarboxylase
MGRTTLSLLDALDLPYWVLEPDEEHLAKVLHAVEAPRAAGRPAFVLVPKGTIAGATPAPPADAPSPVFGRREAVRALAPHLDGALVFATTGYIGRELYGVADAPNNFYMQGSMGHALGLGLGAALSAPERRVVVVDGDGAVLMHQGTCVTVGALGPRNLSHVVLDNHAYESTGGQLTTSGRVDWRHLGAAVGYRSTTVCGSAADLDRAMDRVRDEDGPHLVVAQIASAPGVTPPRVTSGLTPVQLRQRFQQAASS